MFKGQLIPHETLIFKKVKGGGIKNLQKYKISFSIQNIHSNCSVILVKNIFKYSIDTATGVYTQKIT